MCWACSLTYAPHAELALMLCRIADLPIGASLCYTTVSQTQQALPTYRRDAGVPFHARREVRKRNRDGDHRTEPGNDPRRSRDGPDQRADEGDGGG